VYVSCVFIFFFIFVSKKQNNNNGLRTKGYLTGKIFNQPTEIANLCLPNPRLWSVKKKKNLIDQRLGCRKKYYLMFENQVRKKNGIWVFLSPVIGRKYKKIVIQLTSFYLFYVRTSIWGKKKHDFWFPSGKISAKYDTHPQKIRCNYISISADFGSFFVRKKITRVI